MSTIFWLLIIIFFSGFTQSLTGFGSGLVSMALLPNIIGVRTAVPLAILVATTLEFFLFLRYRSAFRLKSIWRVIAASFAGLPLGVWALRSIDEKILLPILGVIMTGYALYALFNFKLPRLEHPGWAYLAGFIAGLLGGAFSASSPPVIIYAHCRGWDQEEFKGNLQGFFLLNDILAIVTHGLAGNLTPPVVSNFLYVLPALALGYFAGTSLDRYLDPQRFRTIVLILLAVMGVRLITLAF